MHPYLRTLFAAPVCNAFLPYFDKMVFFIIQAFFTLVKALRFILPYFLYNSYQFLKLSPLLSCLQFLFSVKRYKLFMEKNSALFVLFPNPLESDRHTVVINDCVNCLSLMLLI